MGNSHKAGNKTSKVPIKKAKLTKKDEKFLIVQTGLNKKQVEDVFQMFSVEKNPDGLIDKEQFKHLYQQLRHEPPKNLDQIENLIFRTFDEHHHGSITFNEFLIGYALTTTGVMYTRLS
jgi:Ca2+-binding EF-hand superfamily protein